jgi:hypothetical protein
MGPRGGKPPVTDDLALEMNFDPVTVKLIRQVNIFIYTCTYAYTFV